MRIALRHLGRAVNQSDLYKIVRIVLPGRANSDCGNPRELVAVLSKILGSCTMPKFNFMPERAPSRSQMQ
jgi:hypothetical protein